MKFNSVALGSLMQLVSQAFQEVYLCEMTGFNFNDGKIKVDLIKELDEKEMERVKNRLLNKTRLPSASVTDVTFETVNGITVATVHLEK